MATTTGQKDFSGASQRNPKESYVTEAKDKAKEGMDKAKDMASNVAERASDIACNVAHGARELGENISQRAQDAVQAVGSGMRQATESIREYVPSGDQFAEAGRQLREGVGHIGEDLTSFVRRNPVPALLVAAAVGFLFARATRS